MSNKVKFNLKNVHYATVTVTGTTVTYGTPVAWPGAVSLSLDAEGDENTFYADGIAYYVTYGNDGYSGDLETALIPNSFREDILQETKDGNILYEDATKQPKPFALLFQFDGDENAIKHVLYNCSCGRPSISSQTNEAGIEVRTETVSVKAAPRSDGYVKARCDNSSASSWSSWFTTVQTPPAAST